MNISGFQNKYNTHNNVGALEKIPKYTRTWQEKLETNSIMDVHNCQPYLGQCTQQRNPGNPGESRRIQEENPGKCH